MRHLILLIIFVPFISFSQTGVIQDGKGEAALAYYSDSVYQVNVNAQNTGISFLLKPNKIKAKQKGMWNGQVNLSGKDGQFPTVKKGLTNFQGTIATTYKLFLNGIDKYHQCFYVSADIGISRFNIFDSTLNVKDQKYIQTSINNNFQLGYNHLGLFGIDNSPIVFGAAWKTGWGNNTDNLDTYEYKTVIYSQNNVQVNSKTDEGYLKSQYKDRQWMNTFMVDIGYSQLINRLLPMIHLRYKTLQGSVPTFNPGIGIYVTEKSKPSSAMFGLQCFANDITNNLNKDTSVWERTNINFVLGFKFK